MKKVRPESVRGKLDAEAKAFWKKHRKDLPPPELRPVGSISLDESVGDDGAELHEAISEEQRSPGRRRLNARDIPSGFRFNEKRGRLYSMRAALPGFEAMVEREARWKALVSRVTKRLAELYQPPEGMPPGGGVFPPSVHHLEALEALDEALHDSWKTSLGVWLSIVARNRKENELRAARSSARFTDGDAPVPMPREILDGLRALEYLPPKGLTLQMVKEAVNRVQLAPGGRRGGGWSVEHAVRRVSRWATDPAGFAKEIEREKRKKDKRRARLA